MQKASRIQYCLCIGLMLSDCSIWNSIDVCKKEATKERTLNRRHDGSQKVSTPFAAAALPGGGAVVAFHSDVPGSSGAIDLHLARIGADGQSLPGCSSPNALDEVIAAADSSLSATRIQAGGVVAGPSAPGRAGLVAFVETELDGITPRGIWGRFFDEDGCLLEAAFEIGAAAGATWASPPRVVDLGLGPTGEEEYAVLWLEEIPGHRVDFMKARVVRRTGAGAVFSPNVSAPDGGEVALPVGADIGSALSAFAAAATVPGQFSLAWLEPGAGADGTPRARIWLARFDRDLKPAARPVALGSWQSIGDLALAMAFDGTSLLIASLQRDASGRSRLYSRAVDERGGPFLRPGAAEGEPLLLGAAAGVVDSLPTVVPLARGGFLVAWKQVGVDSKEGDIRAIALEGNGAPRFNTRACAAEDFGLSTATAGDQAQSTFAVLASGSVLAAWTDYGPNGPDPSGSVRGAVLRMEDLFADPQRAVYGSFTGESPSASCLGEPGTVRASMPCLCTSDCAPGATCIQEDSSGWPGGRCTLDCGAGAATTCGPGELCVNGTCGVACASTGDCLAGRICKGGVCAPFCASDGDCRSGNCNLYTNHCDDGSQRKGGGLDAPCLRNDDCLSGICTSGTCSTTCSLSRPNCPENGGCFPFDAANDQGLCHRSYGNGSSTGMMFCDEAVDCRPGAGAQCLSESEGIRDFGLGNPRGICAIRCDPETGAPCSADERCVGHYCYTLCETPEDCPQGRACASGVCMVHCSADEDCESKHCDLYSGKCYADSPRTCAGRLDATCQKDEDCCSGTCDSATHTCRTFCQLSRPSCPEGAVCSATDPGSDFGVCHKAPPAAGLPCEYPWDCRAGSTCIPEGQDGPGIPGGICFAACDSGSNRCAANETCELGQCIAACKKLSDCPAGRACILGTCVPMCAADSDCRSGHCDLYTGYCGTPGDGLGIDASCRRHSECKSQYCGAAEISTCTTFCLLSRPNCPENAYCVGSTQDPSDDGGVCHLAASPGLMTCRVDFDCRPNGTCLKELVYGYPGGACYLECSPTANPCKADEVCGDDGLCAVPCEPGDCPKGRVCHNGTCRPRCAADDDCPATGHCNLYTGKCYDGSPLTKAGIDVPCQANADCSSNNCDPATSTCLSYCLVTRPNCPENARCVRVAEGDDRGECHQ
jgi:hypothetical protein